MSKLYRSPSGDGEICAARIKRRKSTQSAYTMTELLTVIAIVLLLAALLFPAFRNARKQSYVADATIKSRQVISGLILYKEDAGGWPQNFAWEAVDSGHINPAVMYVKGDPRPEGLATWIERCEQWPFSPADNYRNSFEDAFGTLSGQQHYLRQLNELGEQNPALVAYRGAGDWHGNGPPRCFDAMFGYQGRIVRGRLDGSVTVENFWIGGASATFFCPLSLFTSIPPDVACAHLR